LLEKPYFKEDAMNSKERVLRAIRHEEIDRVPMFMDCTTSDVLQALIERVGAKDDEDMLQRLHIDCRWCNCIQDHNPVNVHSKGSYTDMWGVEKSNYGGMPLRHPLEGAETVDELESYPHWPSPDDIDVDGLVRKMELFPEHCVFGGMWGPFLEQAMLMAGMEHFMIMAYENPEFIDCLLDKTASFYLECNARIFEKAGDKMQIFFMGDDYGTQESLLFSPDMWRRFIKPRLKKLHAQAKGYGYLVMQHSCGSIVNILQDMIDIGLDGIHPIQVTARGMDPRKLKDSFGDKVYFAGSFDAMRILVNGTKEGIDEQVKDRMRILGENGGFIFRPSQGFLSEIPMDNIIYMCQMAYKHGFIRIIPLCKHFEALIPRGENK
jgi:uroporphyrinogen decarboxylase